MDKLQNLFVKNKKLFIYLGAFVALLLMYIVGASFAYYEPETGETTTSDINIDVRTQDKFTMEVLSSYTFPNLTSSNLTQNLTYSNSAKAKLFANNSRASDTYHYYLYYSADSPFIYSDETNYQAEVMLQITYNGTIVTGSNAASLGFDLSEATYRTSNSGGTNEVSGWDVTTLDYVTIINNKNFSTTMGQTIEDLIQVDVVLVKLNNIDQSRNYNKPYTGSLVIQNTVLADPTISYSNANYTVCTNAKCALNELYFLFQ